MARSSTDKIFRHYRSETTGVVPDTADLKSGELFVNLVDRAVFTKDQTDAVVQIAPPGILFDEYSDTAGTTTWTEAQLGKEKKWGLHADTTTGAQTHILPSAWLTPSRELTVNRVGDNDLIIVVDDGREIDGEASGSILQIPGRADYKVLDDNSIVLTSALPHNAGGDAGGSTTTPINQVPVALGEVVTVITNTALRFPLASFDADGAVSAPTITQPANGTVTIVSGNVIEYTPDPDYIGVDEFTFTVADNDGDTSDDGVVSVNVIETQESAYEQPFFAADWTAPATPNGTLQISVTATDHGKGIRPDVSVWADTGGSVPIWNVGDDDSGNLTFTIADTDAFDGYIRVR